MKGFNEARLVTARKNHKCEWCGEAIPFRERHQQYVGKWEGDFQSWRMHVECFEDMEENTRGDESFMPYEHERPEPCATE